MTAGLVLGIGLIAAVVLMVVARSRGADERRRAAPYGTTQGGDALFAMGDSSGDCSGADGGGGDGGGGGD